ncbi:AAA family ATPase [Corynebacterium gerontici]|uniref:DNA polymerase III subunit epsilon n=1 Tax=Corynebacterium gerontici TaxID=2079234 RepID=A0A3G6J8Q1_9CORY|nr:AAA family ATPase [Corynebacterium gerontici]AZA12394.1 DNA polymerase III subunit epsilon [Corynebacterium gerontici]
MTLTITPEFEAAIKALHAGRNLLISGKAGTGKSTLLRMFVEQIEEPGNAQSQKNVLVTAPTGVAAQNIGGFTIHKAFGFRPGLFPDDIKPGGKWRPTVEAIKLLEILDVLIIDEVSMVRADLFDMVDQALRQIRKNKAPFGGVQLVLVGDLLQLPPVVTDSERALFSEQWSSPYFFGAHCYRALELKKVTLTHIWRQSDSAFVEILNEVREGAVSPESLESLNNLVDPKFDVANDWTILCSYRREVERINNAKLDALGSPILTSEAEFTGDAAKTDFNGSEVLRYAVGMRVMVVINDFAGRYVNGSFGTVSSANSDEIEVVLDDSSKTVSFERHVWEVNKPKVSGGRISADVVGTVRQFPIIAAWAITVHKSQGKTIPKCFITLRGGMLVDGQFYVALSRAVDMEHLRFDQEVLPKHIRANNSLVRFLRRETSELVTTNRVVFLSFDGVDFGVSQHVARIHATIIHDGTVVADFGTWLNPNCDLGDFGVREKVPPMGLAAAPEIGDFWPLLRRQAEGGLIVGDGLQMLEAAIRHQQKGMQLNLGTGYDFGDFELTLHGTNPEQRCGEMVRYYQVGSLKLERGEAVPEADEHEEGAVFIPDWASSSEMFLDPSRATDSDIAWAAMSGALRKPESKAEVVECAELLSAWAISRGAWTKELAHDIKQRAAKIMSDEIDLPEVMDEHVDIADLLRAGTKVAWTGSRKIAEQKGLSEDQLRALLAERNLEYRTGVSKTKCDVLIAGDVASMSNKAKRAREYGKPIISVEEFEQWYINGFQLPARKEAQISQKPGELKKAAKADPAKPAPSVISASAESPAVPRDELDRIFVTGARVAFRGYTYIHGTLYPQGGALEELCGSLGLVYKQAVSKTRCDVLVTDDFETTQGKNGLALRYGKPRVSNTDFTWWVEQRLEQQAATETTLSEAKSEVALSDPHEPSPKTFETSSEVELQRTAVTPKFEKAMDQEPRHFNVHATGSDQNSLKVEETAATPEPPLDLPALNIPKPTDFEVAPVSAQQFPTGPYSKQISMAQGLQRNDSKHQKFLAAKRRLKLSAKITVGLFVVGLLVALVGLIPVGAALWMAGFFGACVSTAFAVETLFKYLKSRGE